MDQETYDNNLRISKELEFLSNKLDYAAASLMRAKNVMTDDAAQAKAEAAAKAAKDVAEDVRAAKDSAADVRVAKAALVAASDALITAATGMPLGEGKCDANNAAYAARTAAGEDLKRKQCRKPPETPETPETPEKSDETPVPRILRTLEW